jgi:uncharacterized membrane protein YkvA (DUF1232 family)
MTFPNGTLPPPHQAKRPDPSQELDDAVFFHKIARCARRAGAEVIRLAVVLWVVLRDPATPRSSKAAILAALAYFVMPLDAIPDFLPGAGFVDDLAALGLALAAVEYLVMPDIEAKAEALLPAWCRRDHNSGGVQ